MATAPYAPAPIRPTEAAAPSTLPKSIAVNIKHPAYSQWQSTWTAAFDVYEGAGGFLDETRPYLIAHPREWLDHSVKDADGKMVPNNNPTQPSPKLKMRRKLARYENVAATILDAVMSALFSQAPNRTFAQHAPKDPELARWWKNVDGKGTDYDAFLRDTWVVAAVFGHAIVLMEKGETEGTSRADAPLPVLCRYTTLDLVDWLDDDQQKLTAVKLLELAPRVTFEQFDPNKLQRTRIVNETAWASYDASGQQKLTADHGFGRLPVAVMYGKRRPLTRFIGKSVMGDPFLYIDLYNLVSEVRELLRNQTFAILNVPVGKDGDVESEQQKIGRQSGTSNVLFSTNPADYISPSAENVKAYHEHMDRLTRMIYRLASVPWESDSKDAEAEGSRKVKRQEMEDSLKKYASEMARTDAALTELFYRARAGEQWERARDVDGLSTVYPEEFTAPDLDALVLRVAEAIGLELGDSATRELKKRTARTLLPRASTELLGAIDAELDAQHTPTANEKRQDLLAQTQTKLALHQEVNARADAGGAMPPTPPPPTNQE